MIRTKIIPENTNLQLSIPKDYVGKQVEILVFTTDEIKDSKSETHNVSSLRGKLQLTEEQYQEFQHYIKDSRNEW